MFGFMLHTVLQVAVAAFIIWGLFNEKTLIKFEDKIIERIKKRFKASKKRNVYRHESSRHFNDRNCA